MQNNAKLMDKKHSQIIKKKVNLSAIIASLQEENQLQAKKEQQS